MKLLVGVYTALAVVAAGGAVSAADPGPEAPSDSRPSSASQIACPRLPVAIYFGEGESRASRESEELLARVGKTAADCKPERVDLIAHLDPKEGDAALRLALDRLTVVSVELAQQGLPALTIRVATEDVSANPAGGVTGRQVDIHFRTFSAPAAGQSAPTPAPVAPYPLPMAV